MWPFRRKPKPLVPPVAPPGAFTAQAPVFLVDDKHDLYALEYRVGAIARDREQRAVNGERHQQHDMLTAEAVRIAATLLERGHWTRAQFDAALSRVGL